MKYFPLSILFFIIVFLFCVPLSFASAPQITASPSGTINLDESFTVSATMSGLSKGAIYRLRVVIAQPGQTIYFGSTYDGTNWHTGSITDGNFIAVTTDTNGSWSGSIQGKVDPDDPNFTTGSGTYDLKIGRYTQTGSTAIWSDPVSLSIYVPPIPTLTPTSTPVQQLIVKLTPTSIQLGTTKVPTIVISKVPTPIFTLTPSGSASSEILGIQIASISPQISANPKTLVKKSSSQGFPLVVFLTGGILLFVGSITSVIVIYKRRKTQNGEDIQNE